MIKNLVSKALLSIVMDKNAREALENRQKIKKAVKTIEAAKDATAEPAETASSGLPGDTAEARALIHASIEAAEQEFKSKPKLTPARQALINQALEVQRSKANVFDGLTQEQREKLYVVALKSLNPDRDANIDRNAGRYKKKPLKKK
jgi:hypothetical protein